jgi:uncharacterized SAM-binding protein YcdF (DUF218 family)
MKISAFVSGIIGLVLFSFTRFILPSDYIGNISAYGFFVFWLFAILAMLLVFKYPNISKKLFLVSGVGPLLVIFLYKFFGLGASVEWDVFGFVWAVMTFSCFLFLLSAWELWKLEKNK